MCGDHRVTSQYIRPQRHSCSKFRKKERESDPGNQGGSQRWAQTVAGDGSSHQLWWWRGGSLRLCQIPSCATDCDCLARFWPGWPPHRCVPTLRPAPAATGPAVAWPARSPPTPPPPIPPGLHRGRRTGSRQELKMCSDAHHQLPEVITNFTITISARQSQQSRRCRVPRQPAGKIRIWRLDNKCTDYCC